MAASSRGAPGAPAAPRCFVALWPDAATRDALAGLTQALHAANPGTRPVAADNLHCTLAFLGAIEAPRAAGLARRLQGIAVPPHAWHLDRLDWFAAARVLWIGGADDPFLAALAQQVRVALDAAGISYDRKPFAAHVTLLRNLRMRPVLAACPPVSWVLAAPALVVSERDASGALRYRRWPAGDPARDPGG